MIFFYDIDKNHPFSLLYDKYLEASKHNQNSIEAMVLATLDLENMLPNSRFVNAKYITNEEIIFFSNYQGTKSREIENTNNVSVIFYWDTIKVQIRIRGRIIKSKKEVSDKHFFERSNDKNAIAISSNQSSVIDSYSYVVKKYEEVLNDNSSIRQRPSYWGGYSIKPYYFEFWEGQDSRVNKRKVYELKNKKWESYYLEP
jgi:pyridoxamine-phosphate oxidase